MGWAAWALEQGVVQAADLARTAAPRMVRRGEKLLYVTPQSLHCVAGLCQSL